LAKWIFAGITEVLDLKGLKKRMNKTGLTKELTQEGNDKTPIKRANRLMTNWQKFYLSQQALYKRGRDLNIKTL
jgi:hypothetical protein